jgi:hypothetical protein
MKDSKLRKIVREVLKEEIGPEMRYVATMEYYVWAHSDSEAIAQAKAQATDMNIKLDNQAAVTGIVKQQHGEIGNTPVEFNEGAMKMLKRTFGVGVSDEQAAYNKKHGLPNNWKGSKEGYYEKNGEGNSSPRGSN